MTIKHTIVEPVLRIKHTIVDPVLMDEDYGRYDGGVFGFLEGTKIDIMTSPVVEYDISEDQSVVMVTTKSGSNYKVMANPEFVRALLRKMGDK